MIKQAKLWMKAAILVCGTMTALTSCSNDDDAVEPEQQVYAGVPLIILDTDIGSSTDDLFALEMLYRYQEQNRSRLLGLVVNREGEDYAACVDVMNTYYGHGDIPIGLIRDGIMNPKVWIDYKALPTHTDSKGKANGRRLSNSCYRRDARIRRTFTSPTANTSAPSACSTVW